MVKTVDELEKKIHIKSQHIAIMQPYLFPYLGYYQLVKRVNTFVFLDDVNFIKRGYINRNFIRLNNKPYRFTMPIMYASQNRSINKHYFLDDQKRMIDLISNCYKKAPNFSQVMPIIADVLVQTDHNVAELAARSIEEVFNYLGLNRHFLFSSEIPKNNKLHSQDRIIEICKILGAQRYTNAIGGLNLYNREEFKLAGIELEFIRMDNLIYEASGYPFIPNLSIIDVLMICSTNEIHGLLENYDVI